MPSYLDTLLVLLAVAVAVAYLIWRRMRAAKKIARDWSSGHVEACGSCPALTVRKEMESRKTAPPQPARKA